MPKARLYLSIAIALLLLAYFFNSQKAKPKSGNPVIQGWYADPEGAIFDHKFWIYPTFSAKYEDQVFILFCQRHTGAIQKGKCG